MLPADICSQENRNSVVLNSSWLPYGVQSSGSLVGRYGGGGIEGSINMPWISHGRPKDTLKYIKNMIFNEHTINLRVI